MSNTETTLPAAAIDFSSWENIQPLYDGFMARPMDSVTDLREIVKEADFIFGSFWEVYLTLQTKYNANTADTEAKDAFNNLQRQVSKHIMSAHDKLGYRIAQSPYAAELGDSYFTFIRYAKKQPEIYSEANLVLEGEADIRASDYFKIVGEQTINYGGEEIPMVKAINLLEDTDRSVRKEVYEKMAARRLQDSEKLNNLLSELIAMRQQIAANAGCENFTAYQFIKLGRFDYTPEDCKRFHRMVATHITPLYQLLFDKRRQIVGDGLKPWDTTVNISGAAPLRPLDDVYDMVDKGAECLGQIDPSFGGLVREMKEAGNFDLEVRKNKAPGGYMQMKPISQMPFIFMNARNSESDIYTFVHELGHAVHSMLTKDLDILFLKHPPSEICEVAAMGMENISKQYWGAYFKSDKDLQQAKLGHMERCLWSLLNACYVDALQHWMYENPTHSAEERMQKSLELNALYGAPDVDISGHEAYQSILYQRILHIYRVPFYYIEYGYSMVTALVIWKNYTQDAATAIAKYKEALSQGYMVTIPQFHTMIGASFDFTEEYFTSLSEFIRGEIKKLVAE